MNIDRFMVRLGAAMIWTITPRQVVEGVEAAASGNWLWASWFAFCAFGSLALGLAVWRAA